MILQVLLPIGATTPQNTYYLLCVYYLSSPPLESACYENKACISQLPSIQRLCHSQRRLIEWVTTGVGASSLV